MAAHRRTFMGVARGRPTFPRALVAAVCFLHLGPSAGVSVSDMVQLTASKAAPEPGEPGESVVRNATLKVKTADVLPVARSNHSERQLGKSPMALARVSRAGGDHAALRQEEVNVDPTEPEAEGGSTFPLGQAKKDRHAWQSFDNFGIEFALAVLWVLAISSVPLVFVFAEKSQLTWMHIAEGVCLFIWLFSGLLVFQKQLLFKSSHWVGLRAICMTECVYFMAQIMTTVGYGDIIPGTPTGEAVVTVYVFVAIALIAQLVSEVVKILSVHLSGYYVMEDELIIVGKVNSLSPMSVRREYNVPNRRLLLSFGIYVFFVASGVLFWHSYPGEGKTLTQAVYMGVITLSTVGFGAYTADTQMGQAFAAFWMLFGTMALGNLVAVFCEWCLAHRLKGRARWSQRRADLNEVFDQLNLNEKEDRVDELGFMKFALLYANLCTLEDIDHIKNCYEKLQLDDKGTVSIEEIAKVELQDYEKRRASLREMQPDLHERPLMLPRTLSQGLS
mmetsp:Transcript_15392/g.33873  ORF Transcript_15392/g.33873 Transcript_15392/m.33873 type:complete len:503 (-) Transcript_15392:70-1578(-)|eukprot:CAMPEP_0170598142 /NCGR_PEP_ID=MMETSP0224-20130122/16086_1 /TAXON_ID=285029 /ORGANISM="Togula jolla, Strain CCCM 725" /LENGTH=502 /DNA_ID=CAMNT_0010922667 /DNA_START=45 /DNA_END=1553 /DNA_ORIENTATION=+